MQAGNAPLIDGVRYPRKNFFIFPCTVDTTGKIVRLPNERPGIIYNDI